MLLGVIADTHGFLDPQVPTLFAGVDRILHAGDIGPHKILLGLEHIAPVTAVLGNNDSGLLCREVETLELAGFPILMQHIVDPLRLDPTLKRRLELVRARVVVFGHSHKPYSTRHQGTLFLNPGYAGKPRFDQRRSVALLRLANGEAEVEFRDLAN